MLNINKYEEERVALYNPEGNYIGSINELEFLDIRLQICNQSLEGYYIITDNDTEIQIDKNGEVDKWEEGLFGKGLELSIAIRRSQKSKKQI